MFEALAWRVWNVNYVRRCIIRLRELYSWSYPLRRKSDRDSDANARVEGGIGSWDNAS
jgi:hypothetical protein